MTDNGWPLALRQAPPLPRLGEQPLREVQPFGELVDLRLEHLHTAVQLLDPTQRPRRPALGFSHLPADDATPVAVGKITGGEDDRSEDRRVGKECRSRWS